MHALLNLSHLSTLLQQFADAEIPVLSLKGIPLALRLYDDVGSRHAGDIDLWVSEDHVELVHQLLLQSGHTAKTGYAELSAHYQKLYRNKKMHLGYMHQAKDVSVEIHWRLAGTPELFPVSFDEALSRQQLLSSGAIEIPTLGDMDHLLFLYSHASKHMWERLWWLIDIKDFHQLAGSPSPEAILEKARAMGIERAVLASWQLTGEFLDFDPGGSQTKQDPVANKMARWGREYLVNSHQGMNPVKGMLFAMMEHRSLSYKMWVIAEKAVAADDWYRLKLPPGFSWVYLLVRPWFWLQRKAKGLRPD